MLCVESPPCTCAAAAALSYSSLGLLWLEDAALTAAKLDEDDVEDDCANAGAGTDSPTARTRAKNAVAMLFALIAKPQIIKTVNTMIILVFFAPIKRLSGAT